MSTHSYMVGPHKVEIETHDTMHRPSVVLSDGRRLSQNVWHAGSAGRAEATTWAHKQIERYGKSKEVKKTEQLSKPVPEGVSPEKFDSCVDSVKEKQGKKVNEYAVCNAALKRKEIDWSDTQFEKTLEVKVPGQSKPARPQGTMKLIPKPLPPNRPLAVGGEKTKKTESLDKEGDLPIDELAYRGCVAQEKTAGSKNPYSTCRWRLGREQRQAAKSEAKQTPDIGDHPWDKDRKEIVSLLDAVERNPIDAEENKQGKKKEIAIFSKRELKKKSPQQAQPPAENSLKLIRKAPKMKPPMRPIISTDPKISQPKAPMANAMPKAVRPTAPSGAPSAHFKSPLMSTTKKSESREIELGIGMSFNQLKKKEDEFLAKNRDLYPDSMYPKGTYDDIGSGRYEHMGVTERVPLHAKRAQEYLKQGDHFNAASHAKAAISLGASGHIGTPHYEAARHVLSQIPKSGWDKN